MLDELAQALYRALWKKNLDDMLSTVRVGDDTPGKTFKYVSKSLIDSLNLQKMKFRDNALLFRDEYALAYAMLLKWKACNVGGAVICGHPGIGISSLPVLSEV